MPTVTQKEVEGESTTLRDYYKKERRELAVLIPEKAEKILDIGCGGGHLGRLLKSQVEGREVWGVEVNSDAYQEARRWLDHVCCEDACAWEPPVEEGYFDVLVFADVLEHLLDPKASSWREELLAVVDATISYYETDVGGELADQTWGERNRLSMQHPLSRAVPALSRWLDMPREALPGDSDMPRVQSPGWGASERLAVSPGREDEGYFHMPAGQSGHPLSPFFGAGHDAWVEGLPTPLLPGPAESVLTLVPQPG